jgi:hypothetical protein
VSILNLSNAAPSSKKAAFDSFIEHARDLTVQDEDGLSGQTASRWALPDGHVVEVVHIPFEHSAKTGARITARLTPLPRTPSSGGDADVALLCLHEYGMAAKPGLIMTGLSYTGNHVCSSEACPGSTP